MKRMRWCLLLLLFVWCTGCASREAQEPGYQVYVTNADHTRLQSETLTAQGTQPEEILGEMFAKMAAPTATADNYSILPPGVEITDYTLVDGQLTVTFNDGYYALDKADEILLRAGLVMTATQVAEVRTVVFHIGEEVLLDSAGEPVGAMSSSMFINTPVGINSYQYASLTLYFANHDGTKIVREMRNVHYSSNTTLEKVVLEQLLSGPVNQELLPVLPENVSILNVGVEQDTCMVNLSKEFLNVRQDERILPKVTIYAMVNSLCDMLGVDKVQFFVEGQSNVIYKETLTLNGPFHRNSELIETPDSSGGEAVKTGSQPSVGL